jgi:alkanesulfonate monooxygenase SsuD/methylene tetrahydromethanopterin reductase-like flavin-dependent oxidoreductase (luciferase family)
MEGRFHNIKNVTSLPRPTQQPRMPFWTAALSSIDSFVKAGTAGHNIMAIPLAGGKMRELIGAYRNAWKEAKRPGQGKVMLAFHMLCHENVDEAVRIARDPLNRYLKSLVAAASDWTTGTTSKDYANYGKIIAQLDKETFESQVESGAAWVGTPEALIERIQKYSDSVGGFEVASLQVNFNTIGYEDAARSMRLFGEKVIPHFSK